HCQPAFSTASDQFENLLGGQRRPLTGEKTNRYASERSRITFVSANRSAGHCRKSSLIDVPANASQTDAGVSSFSSTSIMDIPTALVVFGSQPPSPDPKLIQPAKCRRTMEASIRRSVA